MSTHNIRFHDEMKISLNISVLELSEEFRRDSKTNLNILAMVNEPSVFEFSTFDCNKNRNRMVNMFKCVNLCAIL